MRRRRAFIVAAVLLAAGLTALAGSGYGLRCTNKACSAKAHIIFGGGKLFEKATGYCHGCGKFVSVSWNRPGMRVEERIPQPKPLAEAWNPATGKLHKVYKCPDCEGAFMEIHGPEELTHCYKCGQPTFEIDPDVPRMMVD